MVPGRIVHPDPDEPAEQKVVFQPLHQLPFRADRIERLQQHRPKQLLRRDRRPPDRRIERREVTLQRRQRLVHDRPDRPQRMIRPNPRLKIDVAEQLARPLVPAAHHPPPESHRSQVNHSPGRTASHFFNSLLNLLLNVADNTFDGAISSRRMLSSSPPVLHSAGDRPSSLLRRELERGGSRQRRSNTLARSRSRAVRFCHHRRRASVRDGGALAPARFSARSWTSCKRAIKWGSVAGLVNGSVNSLHQAGFKNREG